MAALDISAPFRRHFGAFTGAHEFFKLSYDIRHRKTYQILIRLHKILYLVQ
jgi:hypothetical protein